MLGGFCLGGGYLGADTDQLIDLKMVLAGIELAAAVDASIELAAAVDATIVLGGDS